MTYSGGPKPTRQVRNLTALPEAPQELEQPAAPRGIPQQLGGQFMDASQYKADPKNQRAINQLENFVSESGLWTSSQNRLLDSWKKGAKQRAKKQRAADNLLKSDAVAIQGGVKNAETAHHLRSKGQPELAQKVVNSDPWTEHYYWSAEADDVGRNASVKLAAWGAKDLDYISEIDETQRGLAIQAKATELLAGSENIPRDYVTAKIDPLMASVSADIQSKAVLRAEELKVIKDSKTAGLKLTSNLRLAASYNSATGTTDLDPQLIQASFLGYRDYLVTQRGYSRQQATNMLGEFIKSNGLFLDANGDQLNDIGQWVNAKNIIQSLEGVVVDNGQKFLDLSIEDGTSIRSLITKAAFDAGKIYEFTQTQADKDRTRQKKEYLRKRTNESWKVWENDPNDDVILQARKDLKQRMIKDKQAGALPEDYTMTDINEFVEKTYPWGGDEVTPEQEASLLGEADGYIKSGITEIPPELYDKIQGKTIAADVYKKFASARANLTGTRMAAVGTQTDSLFTDITGQVNGWLSSDQAILERRKAGGESAKQADRMVQQAQALILPAMRGDVKSRLKEALTLAASQGQDVTDEKVWSPIYNKILKETKENPIYSTVSPWLDLNKGGSIRPYPLPGNVELGYAKPGDKNPSKPHKIDIRWTDDGYGWSGLVAQKFSGDGDDYMSQVLTKTIVIPESILLEWSSALSSMDATEIIMSDEARRTLHNISVRATNGDVEPWEALKAQLGLYEGGTFKRPGINEEQLRQRFEILGALTNSVNAMSGPNFSDTGVKANLISVGEQSNAVDFTLQKVGDNQFYNNVPVPISGEVVAVSGNETYGNYVVIRSSIKGPVSDKGVLIRISGLNRSTVQVGQRIERGQMIGLQGDGSPIGTTASSSTGTVAPGHLRIQVYHPGNDPDPKKNREYSPYYQRRFFNSMFLPLYKLNYKGKATWDLGPNDPLPRG